MATVNRTVFIAQFKEEAHEHLQRITQHVFQLAENPGEQRHILEEVFRTAHTLKGSARMMGYADLSTLAHKIEDLFVELRDHHLQIQPQVTDLLLYSLDTMMALVDGLESHQPETSEIAPIVGLFDTLLAGSVIDLPQLRTFRFRPRPEPDETLVDDAPADTEPAENLAEEGEDRQFIRVRTKDLDAMLNLVGEVLMNQYRYDGQLTAFHPIIRDIIQQRQDTLAMQDYILRQIDVTAAAHLLDLIQRLEQDSAHLLRRTKALAKKQRADRQQMRIAVNNLQEHVIDIRMVPAARMFTMLPRLARMTARRLGKQVEVRTLGEETRIDTRLAEELRDPLMHLLQNAIRHGIEAPAERERAGKPPRGAITVSAAQEGNRIVVRVADDGAGINLNRIKDVAVRKGIVSRDDTVSISDQDLYGFLFQSGFSTAESVDDIAGRGFGLDIVRDHVDRVQGEIEVRSQPGLGTEFNLKLPLTLTMLNTLMVRVADQIFAIPTSAVERTFEYQPDRIEYLGQIPTVVVDSTLLPMIDLHRILRFSERHPLHLAAPGSSQEQLPDPARQTVIVLCSEEHRVGFIVDDLVEECEIVIKHLGPCLKRVRHVAGATALREDTVIILFVRDLIHSADAMLGEMHAQTMLLEAHASADALTPSDDQASAPRILVIDDSLNTREVERAMLERAGYLVETSANGLDGLHKLRALRFDAVLTDIEMPGLDGLQVTRTIRADPDFAHMPVVVVSARGSQEARQASLDAGAVAHLVKGEFDEQTLIRTLADCLNGGDRDHGMNP